MQKTESSHKTILKTTGVFGFTQILKMSISVIGAKFIAIFLGPVGIGIAGLLNNTISIVSSLTSFGIQVVSVREMSLAHAENDLGKFSKRFIVLERWSIAIGLFGGILTLCLSSVLSKLTFGSNEYQLWFVFLSINFILSSLTASRVAILQGMRMIRSIAVSNLVISILITIVTIPIYYFFRLKGIVSVILLSSAIALAVNLYFTRNVKILKLKITLQETIRCGKPLIKLGFLLSINVLFGQICTYIIKLYLNNSGTTAEILGFYEVSTIILLSYVGMIFNAMNTDYYPRLTAVSNDNVKIKALVNDQIEIALLIITPAITFLYLTAPILIRTLYSKDFLEVVLILKAALFAVIIRAIIWPLAYVILAKGENRLYFKQELLGDALNILLTIALYHFLGLIGIGLANLINFSIYGFYVYFILKNKFEFDFRKDTLRIMVVSCLIGLLNCLILFFVKDPNTYFLIGILLVLSCIYSYKELDKRVDIMAYLVKMKHKIKSK
ncbi:oligosaccharide flippase family protein [Wenyingzhuangia sp. 2_MG-2023]|uniref:oligosaccharide flippase family protein n=1 Tax=Wenyingzhuangia sp. 2_MG-2023 TaxID=3062639 RepID=UPI0026E26FCE|nr:oligosaccharide flippase family protein [Wenyingzhuangia sp. 2_MG-2023]MDO6736393.1 oligosaccharide flippase family protein [Wenyingzhuangia sp. 2_MG-2023]